MSHCQGCPFVKDCPDCPYRGGESTTFDTILATLSPGQTATVDTLRDVIDAAQLTRFERGELFRHGVRAGLLTTAHRVVPSTHPAAKGRLVQLYTRTAKPVRGAA